MVPEGLSPAAVIFRVIVFVYGARNHEPKNAASGTKDLAQSLRDWTPTTRTADLEYKTSNDPDEHQPSLTGSHWE